MAGDSPDAVPSASRRGGLGWLATLGVLLCVASAAMPFEAYWLHVFERLCLRLTWPLVLCAVSVLFGAWGYRTHHRDGLQLSAPVLAPLFALACCVAFFLGATWWSTDWSSGWCYGVILVLGGTAVFGGFWVCTYAELWRRCRWTNRAVVRHVRRAVERGRFSLALRRWCSRHCLHILDGCYEDAKRALLCKLEPLGSTDSIRKAFIAYARAARAVEAYLQGNLESTGQPGNQQWERRFRIAEVLRELLTVRVWCASNGVPLPEDSTNTDSEVDLLKKLKKEVDALEEAVSNDKGPPPSDVHAVLAFLQAFLKIATCDTGRGAELPPAEEAHKLQTAYEAFQSVPEWKGGGDTDWRGVIAATWLTFSHGFREEARLDAWVEMCACQRAELLLPPVDPGDAVDMALALARPTLAGLLRGRVDNLPSGWVTQARFQSEYATEVAHLTPYGRDKKEEEKYWSAIEDRTRETASWLYREALHPRSVRALIGISAMAILAFGILALWAANPRLPAASGWNKADFVADVRPWHDYARRAPFTASAASERFVALASSSGVVLVNRVSRVPRELDWDVPTLDLTVGLDHDGFLALLENQGIASVTATPWTARGLKDAKWLKAPKKPVWPGVAPPELPDVLGCELDHAGWLIAIRGVGLARYLIEQHGADQTRLRSWQTGTVSHLSVQKTVFTDSGVWCAVGPAEGPSEVVFVDRESLDHVSDRHLACDDGIVALQADRHGQWATAQDARHRIWLLGSSGIWQGPFLGQQPKEEGRLAAVSDVHAASYGEPVAWLGTKRGLFAYDQHRRHIAEVIANAPVIVVQALPSGSSARSAVAATEKGIVLVRASTGEKYTVQELDKMGVRFASISEDGQRCAYLTAPQRDQEFPGAELRAVSPLSQPPQPATVIPAAAWSEHDQLEVVNIGTIPKGDARCLFATNQGAFAYDPDRHQYEDCSTVACDLRESGGATKWVALNVGRFQQLVASLRGQLAIAECVSAPGHSCLMPLRFGSTSAVPNARWLALDPARTTSPTQITECVSADGQGLNAVFGLGQAGELHRYGYPVKYAPESVCTGAARSLPDGRLSANTVKGDLEIGSASWRVAFVGGGRTLCVYDAATAHMSEWLLPAVTGTLGEPAQILLQGERQICLLRNGSVLVADKQGQITRSFATGDIDFAPGEATALGPGPTPDSVVLAGPAGQVAIYDWPSGSFVPLGSTPLPGVSRDTPIVDVFTASGMALVRRSDDAVFALREGNWQEQSALKGYAANGRGIWAMHDEGLSHVPLPGDMKSSKWPEPQYCTGRDTESFVKQARFVWQMDEHHVAVFSGGPSTGVYDVARDTWTVSNHAALQSPTHYAPSGQGLVVHDRKQLFMLDKELKAQPLATLDTGQSVKALWATENDLRAGLLEESAAVLRRWPRIDEKQFSDCRRARAPAPGNFDPATTVYAEERGTRILLVGPNAECLLYEPTTARWQAWRSATVGQQLAGWLPAVDASGTTLVIGRGSTTELVTLANEGLGASYVLNAAPESVPAMLDRVAERIQAQASRTPALAPAFRGLLQPLRRYQSRWRDGLKRPQPGRLLSTTALRIEREGGATRFEFQADGQWVTLHARVGGFDEDQIHALAFDEAGQLWALHAGGLIALKPDENHKTLLLTPLRVPLGNTSSGDLERGADGRIRLVGAQESRTLLTRQADGFLKPAETAAPTVLAEFELAGWQMAWLAQANGTFDAEWRSAAGAVGTPRRTLSPWSDQHARLASQVVSDVAVAGDGRLLLATELGLLVRDAQSFELKAIYPELRGVRLVRMCGPDRVLVAGARGWTCEWKDDNLTALPDERSPQVSALVSGAWVWEQTFRQPRLWRVAVRHVHMPQRLRRWSANYDRWRFDDDRVNWLVRGGPGLLWLATNDGLWPFDPQRGRVVEPPDLLAGSQVARAWMPPSGAWAWTDQQSVRHRLAPEAGSAAAAESPTAPTDELIAGNPAMKIRCAGGQLTFLPADGGPAIENGRFFFDNARSICGSPGALYTLIPRRGLLKRDPQSPSRINDWWPVPEDAAFAEEEDGSRTLPAHEITATGDTVRLLTGTADAPGRFVFELDVRRRSAATWQRIGLEPPYEPCEFGPIQWIRRQAGETLAPFLSGFRADQTAEGQESTSHLDELENWWSKDRFAWDRALDVSVLDPERLVVATPLGAGVLRATAADSWPMERLEPASGLTRCGDAVHTGTRFGVVAFAPDGSSQVVIESDPKAPPSRRAEDKWLQRPLVEMKHSGSATQESAGGIELAQKWAPQDASASSWIALRVDLPPLDPATLLRDGQFVFDWADSVCGLSGAGCEWLTCARTDRDGAVLCLNAARQCREGAPALVLEKLWTTTGLPDAIRPGAAGEVLGLFGGTRASGARIWQVQKGRFGDGWTLQWTADASPAAQATFVVGQTIDIHMKTPLWTATPRTLADEFDGLAPLRTSHPIPLFVTQGDGLALAFDVFQSLALDPVSGRMAVGTRGGVIVTEGRANPLSLLSSNGAWLAIDEVDQPPLDARRVRWDSSQLWARFQERSAPCLWTGDRWQVRPGPFPGERAVVDGVPVTLVPQGVTVAGRLWTRSNDAWSWGTRSTAGGLDLYMDRNDDRVWLVTSDGLFRLVPRFMVEHSSSR